MSRERAALPQEYGRERIEPALSDGQQVVIYALIDGDQDIWYVGQTVQPVDRRFDQHRWAKGSAKVRAKLRELQQQGVEADFVVLAIATRTNANAVEKRYIDRLRDMGYTLVNAPGHRPHNGAGYGNKGRCRDAGHG